MLMLHQIKKISKLRLDMNIAKDLFYKNIQAVKTYWPIILLMQLPIFMVCFALINQKPVIQTSTLPDKKNLELHKRHAIHIKNIEQRFNELNKRFAALQIQHAKFVKSSILLTATVQQSNVSSTLVKKNTLDIIDRIGEKIRLNEPYPGLLASLPKECSIFSEYQSLQQFSAKLPLTFIQLKKSFEDIRKSYIISKTKSTLPKWLEKIARLFHGNIKIEKIKQIDESPLQSISDALEAQDLKLAYSFAKHHQFQPIQLWSQRAAERILLEDEYSTFAEKVQNWVQQIPLENEQTPIDKPQEKLP